jgi:hypothetical protein
MTYFASFVVSTSAGSPKVLRPQSLLVSVTEPRQAGWE